MPDEANFSKLAWEVIEKVQSKPDVEHMYLRTIRRAKVHGGWLVQARVEIRDKEQHAPGYGQGPSGGGTGSGLGAGVGLTFVPDPNHDWKLD